MASKTTNYGLHKFDLTDSPPDITAINDSMDKIDTELKKRIENTKALPIENGGTGKATADEAFGSLGKNFGFPNAKNVGDNTDLNTLTKSGFYFSAGSKNTTNTTNIPQIVYDTIKSYYELNIQVFGLANRVTQIAPYPYNNSTELYERMWVRTGVGTSVDSLSWSDWREIFNSKRCLPVKNGGTGASTADMALRYLGGDYIFIRRDSGNDSGITESDANTMTKTGVVLTPTSGTKNFPDFFSKYNGADNGRKTLVCFNVGNPTGYNGYIAFDHYSEEFAMRMGTGKAWRRVLTDKNKPRGTYSGNGDSTSRTINASGFGNVIVVYSRLGIAIVTPNGAVVTENGGTSTYLSSTEAMYLNGVMTLATTNKTLNASGYIYGYECK